MPGRLTPGKFPRFLDVLRRIKGLRYEGFETTFRNVQDHFASPAQARDQIEAAGLRFVGVHIFLMKYDPVTGLAPRGQIEEVARGGAKLGAERLILSGRASFQNGRFDLNAAHRKAEELETAGKLCQSLGIGLAYHNHHLEFQSNGIEMRTLLENTDPERVHLMLDAGHAFVGGADSVSFFERHQGRITGMHLRDFRNGRQVPLGQGDYDLSALAAAVRRTRWKGWLVNEEERPNDTRLGESVVKPAREQIRSTFGL